MPYLWAPLRYSKQGTDADGKPNELKTFGVGESISQGSMSDEDWNYLVETGVIRDEEYPIPKEQLGLTNLEAPRDVIIRKAQEALAQAQGGMRLAQGRVEVPPDQQ
jgi:hypothetical protein